MIRKLLLNQTGSIAIVFALMFIPLVGMAGIAVDLGRAWVVKTKLGHALDAAALAVGSSTGTQGELESRLQAFIEANFGDNGIGWISDSNLSVSGDTITVDGEAQLNTYFLRVFGYEQLTVSTASEVLRETKGVEVVMVLDNTGSMWSNDNITALRTASYLFIDVLFGEKTYDPNMKIGVVPYTSAVNPGDAAVAITQPLSIPFPLNLLFNQNYDPSDDYAWKGCVIERPYPHDTYDTSVADGGLWEKYYWVSSIDNLWIDLGVDMRPNRCNAMTGPNLGCGTPITPLTSDKITLTDAIDVMTAWCRGGTMSNIGMSWGWRVLSPEAPFEEGSLYGDTNWQKIAILMTDGENQFWRYNVTGNPYGSDYTGYERIDEGNVGTTSRSTGKTIVNNRLAEVCQAMKDEDILIYTITFTSSIGSAVRDIYRQCATDPGKYYNAPSQDDLVDAFEAIAKEISNLRITR